MLKDITKWFPKEEGWRLAPQDRVYSAALLVEVAHPEKGTFMIKGLPDAELMNRSLAAHDWFHTRGLAPQAIWCRPAGQRQWMLMEKAKGVPAFQYDQPVGAILGNLLQSIHSLPIHDFFDQQNQMVSVFSDLRGAVVESFQQDLVVSHGDFCLPNIMIESSDLVQIIDLGDAGLYDRYVDVYWAMWSLRFNKLGAQIPSFLRAYGLLKPDLSKLITLEKVYKHPAYWETL